MGFNEIYGHDRIKELLNGMIKDNKVGHAYIFEGKSGIGRLSMATAFAQTLIYGEPNSRPIEQASNCPDIRIITNELYDPARKESQSILVSTIRQMKSEVYIKPYSADKKIYIVPNADTMTSEAQNSLLKVLEEPPSYAAIILIAENATLFLPTILSRAVIIKFLPLDSSVILQYLNDKADIGNKSTAQLELISKMSGGSIKTALDLLSDDTASEIRGVVINYLLGLSNSKSSSAYEFILYAKKNKKQSKIILDTIFIFFRDIMIIGQTDETKNITNIDVYDRMRDFAQNTNQKSIAKVLDIILKYSRMIEGNANYSAAVERLILGSWEEINGRDYRSQI